jgi:signal transduction histidine kinase
MKKFIEIFTFIAVLVMLCPIGSFLLNKYDRITTLDVVEVNALISEVQNNWNSEKKVYPECSFDYAIIDNEEKLIYKFGKNSDSVTIVKATANRDTIRDVVVNDEVVGKVIIYNHLSSIESRIGNKYLKAYLISVAVCFLIVILGILWIEIKVVRPFEDMREFAEAVASGDLDKPLKMDKENMFGAFTESFDIMREELALAKERELQANISKKELIAQLSHDLKTPVASIKAMSEVLSVKEDREELRGKIVAIGDKADQIDRLVSDLFTSTLEELDKLEIVTSDMESTMIERIIRGADYKGLIKKLYLVECMVQCDKIRLNQVISNIIYNSYKYANTSIYVNSHIENDTLTVSISDKGGGVPNEELALITEKYKRGTNAVGMQGAGLGLYISKELMENMQGSLEVANVDGGFQVSLGFKLA